MTVWILLALSVALQSETTASGTATPTFTTQTLDITGDDDNPRMVAGLAVSDDTILVTLYPSPAHDLSHTVASFIRRDGEWIRAAALPSPDPEKCLDLSGGVSINGDECAIGAYLKCGAGERTQNVVLFYKLVNGVWQYTSEVAPPAGRETQSFGSSVHLEGDFCVVGSSGDDMGERSSVGRTDVYRREDGVWRHEAELTPPPEFSTFMFGFAIDLEFPYLAIAPREIVRDRIYAPAPVFVFRRENNQWVPDSVISRSPIDLEKRAGVMRVAFANGKLWAGGAAEDGKTRVTAYIRDSGTWREDYHFDHHIGGDDARAVSVGIHAQRMVVASGSTERGTVVHVFSGDANLSNWKLVAELEPSASGAGIGGHLIDIDGRTIVAVEMNAKERVSRLHVITLNEAE